MIDKNDWRLMDQMDYLFKKDLLHIHYLSQQAGWDHDHCEFCSDTIDSTTGTAYCTPDKRYWICESCFDDFLEMFQWEPHNFEQPGKKSFTNRVKEQALLR